MTTLPEAFFHAIPKMELHCHLLGTVREHTFRALALKAKAPLSAGDIDSFYTRDEKPVGVLRVLRALDACLLKTPDDLHRIAYEYLEDAASHNVRYAEFFWNPTGTFFEGGLSFAVAQSGIIRAIRDAKVDFGIVGRLVPSIDREASPQHAVEMVEWMCAHRCDETIGLGMDYRENDRPPELFEQAYADARRAGFYTTAHAGEFGMPWLNVKTAVERLQVNRIDHGYTVVDEPAFAQTCIDRGLVFTVVPTNSYYLRTLPKERWALDHPIRKMHALGLALHPNTDDPSLHKVTQSKAWQMMHHDFGLNVDDLKQCMLNGLKTAWIDESDRQILSTVYQKEFDAVRQNSSI